MEKAYDIGGKRLIIRHGNIADYVGGAIAVHSSGNLDLSNAVSHAILDKAESLGNGRNMFRRIKEADDRTDNPYQPAEGIAKASDELTDVGYIIYAICEGVGLETDDANYKFLNRTARNVLLEAERFSIGSVAFPAFNSGPTGVILGVSVGAIADAAIEHFKRQGTVESVTLYLYERTDYRVAESILDAKLAA